MYRRRNPAIRILCTLLCCVFLMAFFSQPVFSLSYHTTSNYTSSVYYRRLTDVALTGDARVDIVNIALSQYGYSESSSGQDLSGMKEGFSNYTEYGHWYGMQSLWCAMFVSWCAYNAGIPEDVIPSHAYTASGVLWFMDRHQAYTRTQVQNGLYTPQAGDLIYFHFSRNNSIVNHVGIVIGYFDGYVYTVEGNINFDPSCSDGGQVLVRSRKISDTAIRYICSPDYSTEQSHAVGNFFPSQNIPSTEESLDIPQQTGPDANVEITQSANSDLISEKPQYSFIP